ncbi:MAG: Holliday junction resolvase RuvX [Bacteroidetes bacterium]|nr:Holliday junction resolvase RuvX [Bacteroidota bacterium]
MSKASIVLKNNQGIKHPRIVSVDYGTQRVGLSLADPLQLFAQPLTTCSPRSAIEKLISLHERETIGTIVIGWPLNEDGSEGEATRRVDRYIRKLDARLPGVEIIRWDERYTSEEAKSRFIGRKSKKKQGYVDQIAAGIILQEYLDSISETTDHE